jgi:hypothetical protein
VLLTLEANDLSIGTDAESVYDAFASGELGRILSLVLVNFLNPLMKIIRGEAGWSWDFLKSWNFRTQALTAVLIFFTGIGVVFPDGAVANLIDALAGGELNVIIIALVANIINPFIHFFRDKAKDRRREVIINPFIHFFRDKAKDRRREVPGESETPDSTLGKAIA